MPNLLKECKVCKLQRDAETEFHYNGAKYADGSKKKRADCVYCCRKRRSEYFQNPEKRAKINSRRRRTYGEDRKTKNRIRALKFLYGLTLEQYDQMRLEQDFKCACCHTHESLVTKKKLYVDHNHTTNKIRGLLCATCNSALGLFKEDPVIMQNAIKYLKK